MFRHFKNILYRCILPHVSHLLNVEKIASTLQFHKDNRIVLFIDCTLCILFSFLPFLFFVT